MATFMLKTWTVVRERPDDYQGKVAGAEAAAAILRKMYEAEDANQEVFSALLCNNKNNVFGFKALFKGGIRAALVDVGTVFTHALLSGAAAVIVCHNHPSGDPTPSPEDDVITRSLAEAGKILHRQVLDHIVLGEGSSYYSYQEHGKI